MPPGAKRKKLDSEEVALIKAWIDTGAKGPSGPTKPMELVTPKIPLKAEPRRAINSVAFSPQTKLMAVARYGEVELRSETDQSLITSAARRSLKGHRGNVNAV